jgi:hypothetical protein
MHQLDKRIRCLFTRFPGVKRRPELRTLQVRRRHTRSALIEQNHVGNTLQSLEKREIHGHGTHAGRRHAQPSRRKKYNRWWGFAAVLFSRTNANWIKRLPLLLRFSATQSLPISATCSC